jgi:hypothetical protein
MTAMATSRVSVERLMRDIENEVRQVRRARLMAPGGSPSYDDRQVFAAVERVLRRAIEERDPELLLIPDLLGDEGDWRLETKLTFSSHRPVIGPVILFFKRRVLLPLTRWLFEYSRENFQRQQRINLLLFACIEELAIENARLVVAAGLDEDGMAGAG